MKDKKKIVIGALCALIMIMAVGYALLSQQLSINGTANITSTWKIEITNITEKERHGGVTEKAKSYDAMTANFDVGFTSPGDYITYDVEVTNSGTLDAVIERINVVTNDNPAIIYTTSGIKRGDVIEHNSKKYLTVKIGYDSSVTSQPQTNNNALTLQLFTEQNLGQVQPDYDYRIGDIVEFAGSKWYVIKNSTEDEDYVMLMKTIVLDKSELGTYAYHTRCNGGMIGNYGCTYDGQTVTLDTALFDINHTNFDTSNVKQALDYYVNNHGISNKLKEIDGYKIRLITKDELINNFGFSYQLVGTYNALKFSTSTPTFIYEGYDEGLNYVRGYWTMTSDPEYTSASVWYIRPDGHLYSSSFPPQNFGVRPVINLLKSAIE